MKRSRKGDDSFDQLEAHWYGKLEASGFRDIEDTSDKDRPLKEWHSSKFTSQRSRMRQEERERYDQKLAALLNDPRFPEICRLIAQHGNNIGEKRVRRILELHRAGATERAIARKARCGKTTVHRTLTKAKQWLKLAA